VAKKRVKIGNSLKPLTFDQAIAELGKFSNPLLGDIRKRCVDGRNTPDSKIVESSEKEPIHRRVKSSKHS
jgi:hypothetical protein